MHGTKMDAGFVHLQRLPHFGCLCTAAAVFTWEQRVTVDAQSFTHGITRLVGKYRQRHWRVHV